MKKHPPPQIFFHPPKSKYENPSLVGALIQMCDQWLSDMDKGKINGVVFLDIHKAFHSINHKILFRKLKNQFGRELLTTKFTIINY